MKLHWNPASPYVRKVLVVAHEAGLADRLETAPVKMTPVNPNDALNRDNPLGKIPALVTDDGETLFDSRVICEYLDGLHDGTPMFPAERAERFAALRLQAIGDGILDAGVLSRYENAVRPEAFRWPPWLDGQRDKMLRGVARLEAELDSLAGRVDIGAITAACALGYLDFRFDHIDWRTSHGRLAEWFAGFDGRASMQATTPADLA